jgi:hypothetical protein
VRSNRCYMQPEKRGGIVDCVPDGNGSCWRCGRPFRFRGKPPRRNCRGPRILVPPPCPLAPILHAAPPTADHAAYVSRLRRCLSAGCGLIHRVDGRIICVGRGRRCQWLGEWARFLAGEEGCPHWGESAVVPPGERAAGNDGAESAGTDHGGGDRQGTAE